MRENKFRAWDKIKKRWYYASLQENGWTQHDTDLEYSDEVSDWQQYTGLHDKNGKEIWEGDVVRVLYPDWASKPKDDPRTLEQYLIEEKCVVGHIIYNTPSFEIDFGIGKYGDRDFGRISGYSRIEVIGNIYENPELVKEVENE